MVESGSSVTAVACGGWRGLRPPFAVAAAWLRSLCMLAAVAWLFCGSGADAGEAGAFYCAGSEPLWEVSVQAGKGQFGTVLEGTRALVGRAEVTPGGKPGWR